MHHPRVVTTHEWGRIFARAWSDPHYAELLTTDPTAAVKHELHIDAQTPVCVFVVPPRPEDLTDEQLERVRHGKELILPLYCC